MVYIHYHLYSISDRHIWYAWYDIAYYMVYIHYHLYSISDRHIWYAWYDIAYYMVYIHYHLYSISDRHIWYAWYDIAYYMVYIHYHLYSISDRHIWYAWYDIAYHMVYIHYHLYSIFDRHIWYAWYDIAYYMVYIQSDRNYQLLLFVEPDGDEQFWCKYLRHLHTNEIVLTMKCRVKSPMPFVFVSGSGIFRVDVKKSGAVLYLTVVDQCKSRIIKMIMIMIIYIRICTKIYHTCSKIYYTTSLNSSNTGIWEKILIKWFYFHASLNKDSLQVD